VHALIALTAAALSGSGDFLGGLASRRGRVTSVVFINHVAGLAAMLVFGPLFGGSLDAQTILWGSLAGLSGVAAVMALYAGFARSSMAVVSPIAAVGAGAWPVVFDVVRGDVPGPVVLAGILLGLVAIWTISSGDRLTENDAVGAGVAYGMIAGLGFGGLLILLSLGSDSSGVWALLPARVAGTIAIFVVILATNREFGGDRGVRMPSIAAGILVTLGNSLFVVAATKGSLAVVSVLAAMFPAATVILAWIVLHERLTRRRQIGLLLALIAVGLVAGG
jgi:drug/metabolite transporter (DMT)-like permease